MSKMKWNVFLKWLLVALNSDTTYALGAFGWQLNDSYKKRLLQNPNNKSYEKAINAGKITTFAFDCICLIKAIFWGWTADNKKNYGGAVYKSNGVPDINADQMMTSKHVSGLSTDFSKIKVGAFVGMKGHIGVYIGNGFVIECTPIWGAKVMQTKLSARKWVNWGMSNYIDYSELDKPTSPKPKPEQKPSGDIKVGDTVVVNGKLFTSSTGSKTGTVNHKDRQAKVERIISNARNPYYVVGSQLSGWANSSQLGGSTSKPTPKPQPLKVGDKVKIKQGSMYQGAAKGKPVTTYALNKTCTIDRIDKGNARLQPINSWVALNDLVRV